MRLVEVDEAALHGVGLGGRAGDPFGEGLIEDVIGKPNSESGNPLWTEGSMTDRPAGATGVVPDLADLASVASAIMKAHSAGTRWTASTECTRSTSSLSAAAVWLAAVTPVVGAYAIPVGWELPVPVV